MISSELLRCFLRKYTELYFSDVENEQSSRLYSGYLVEHDVLCCETPVLFIRERFWAALLSSTLSTFLSSSSILIMLYFKPSRLHPPLVLLHPRPPIISSSTHPLHQSQTAIDNARSAIVSEAVGRFAAATSGTLPVLAATLLLLLHPLLFLFFFFSSHCVKVKKRSHCTGWGEGDERWEYFHKGRRAIGGARRQSQLAGR